MNTLRTLVKDRLSGKSGSSGYSKQVATLGTLRALVGSNYSKSERSNACVNSVE